MKNYYFSLFQYYDLCVENMEYDDSISAPDFMDPSFLDNDDEDDTSLSDSSHLDTAPDSPTDESEILRPRSQQDGEFPLPVSATEHAAELSSAPGDEK